MKLIEITNDNLIFATGIQNQIFKEESAYERYKHLIKLNCEYQKYFLVYNKEKVIGITGYYTNEPLEETNSLWLGWFGVLEEERNKGYAKEILKETVNKIKYLKEKYPIKYFRTYTSIEDNKNVIPLYEKFFDINEMYNNKDDLNYNNTCIIYSKSLTKEEVKPWNNKFLNLKEIIKSEELSKKTYQEERR